MVNLSVNLLISSLLSYESRLCILVKPFIDYIHDLYADIQPKITLSNENYKLAINVHHKNQEFN